MRINSELPSIGLKGYRVSPQNETKFKDALSQAISDVNKLQIDAEVASEKLMLGEIDFHNAMIISEKANLALQLTVAIRNKLIEAYQEIMRMQV
ncbi:MAG: flagellar hook-basal body complex protein FliE [Firmicutes bacterium]|jgi:flagellar hook-basal body complex protein FliE|nr:flagellar hook-basal body complex protein FliE [Bacillota bacterium]